MRTNVQAQNYPIRTKMRDWLRIWVGVCLLGFLAFLPTAEAKKIPLVRLICEGYPIDIRLGLDVADHNPREIRGVYYIDSNKNYRYYTVAQLEEMTLVHSIAGFRAAYVQMDVAPQSSSAQLTVKYLKNGLLLKYGVEDFVVRYNPYIQQYQVLDEDTGRPVTVAYLIPNRVGKALIGLKGFEIR